MKWLKFFFFLSVCLVIGSVWLLSLYLNSRADLSEAKQELQKEKQTISSAMTNDKDTALFTTVEGFCKEVYSAASNRAIIAGYTTARGRAIFLPPKDEGAKSKLDMRTKIQAISIYAGVVKEKQAEVIAAIKRTITINGIATTSTSYVRLNLVKQNKWLVDTGAVIGELPSK